VYEDRRQATRHEEEGMLLWQRPSSSEQGWSRGAAGGRLCAAQDGIHICFRIWYIFKICYQGSSSSAGAPGRGEVSKRQVNPCSYMATIQTSMRVKHAIQKWFIAYEVARGMQAGDEAGAGMRSIVVWRGRMLLWSMRNPP